MNPKKFDHTKEDITSAMGITDKQLDKLMLWGSEISKKLILGKISNIEIAERISAELTDEEIIFLAVLFIQQKTDNINKALPKEIINLFKKLNQSENFDVNVVRVDSKEDFKDLIGNFLSKKSSTSDSEKQKVSRGPLSSRSNNYETE